MPTRSGLDFKTIRPDYFVCAYCYEAQLDTEPFKYGGMVSKRVRVRVDDEFITLDQWTSIWTEPHCFPCNRRIKGYPVWVRYPKRYKYV